MNPFVHQRLLHEKLISDIRYLCFTFENEFSSDITWRCSCFWCFMLQCMISKFDDELTRQIFIKHHILDLYILQVKFFSFSLTFCYCFDNKNTCILFEAYHVYLTLADNEHFKLSRYFSICRKLAIVNYSYDLSYENILSFRIKHYRLSLTKKCFKVPISLKVFFFLTKAEMSVFLLCLLGYIFFF